MRATFLRGLGVLVALVLVALMLAPAPPAAAAEEPALLSFERTSPAVLEAGGTVSFTFTTSVPVISVRVVLKDVAGYLSASFYKAEGGTSGTISKVSDAASWPSGPVHVDYVAVHLLSGSYQTYRRDGTNEPALMAPSALGSLADHDFETINPQPIYQDPRLTLLRPAQSEPVTPEQTASVNFSLTHGAKEVLLVYSNPLDTSQQSLSWHGTSGSNPISAAATAAVTQDWTPGTYQLGYARVTYLDGRAVTHYYRDGRVNRLPFDAPTAKEPLATVATGDFKVANPAKVLKSMHSATLPWISGTATSGSQLIAHEGLWDAPAVMCCEFQWLRNGIAVPGETYSAYSVTGLDSGAKISLRATARAPGYQPATATSVPVGPVPRSVQAYPPVVAGDSSVGGTVRALPNDSSVFPAGGKPSYTYAWKRNGAAIPGATRSSYVLAAADKGKSITVDMTVAYDAISKTKVTGKLRTVIANKPKARGFNADGTTDFFARDAAGNLYLYPTNGKGGWLPRQKIGTGWNGFDKLMASGDFNGDLNNDVMARDRSGRLFLYPGNGKGGWLKKVQVGVGWGGFKDIIAPGDFNGDGNNDIIARDSSNRIWLYPGNGRGGWLAKSVIDTGWGEINPISTSGKFSGFNQVDVIGRDTFGYLRLFPGNGKGQFALDAPSHYYQIGHGWGGVRRFDAAGDFNGDGDEDIWGINSTGTLIMYYGNGRYVSTHGLDSNREWKGNAVVGTGWGGFTAVF